jgi:ATP adenylyltransferase
MERLWAPWRMAYILSGDEMASSCIFCAFPAAGRNEFRKHQILCATEHAFVMMNKYPYNNGHVMVIPRVHAADPSVLPPEAWDATGRLLRETIATLKDALKAQGLNVGMNLGRVAGAGIDQHLHWHVVPRWNGDTNFMPVTADVKVMSEHLEGTYERLVPHFARLGEGPA